MFNKALLRPRNLVVAFVTVAMLMVASSLIELYNSKRELTSLMESQSQSLLRTILIASENTLHANDALENQLYERLLNNANMIKYLYEQNTVDNTFLESFANENNVFRINIFNRRGEKIYRSHAQEHTGLPEKNSPREILQPIFKGALDTMFIGIKQARFEPGSRFAVAIAADDNSAIVLNLDAAQVLEFRRDIGFGNLLRNVIQNPGIVYAVLQDTNGIIAASGNVREMEGINGSAFLQNALSDSVFASRTTTFDTVDVFEAVYPFYHHGAGVGLFRLGISIEPLQIINNRIYRRVSIITVLLLGIGFIVFSAILIWQNMKTVEEQYQVVETYSNSIIHNVSDAIIVFNPRDGITLFNEAAETLFNRSARDVLGDQLSTLLDEEQCAAILADEQHVSEIDCVINGNRRSLLVPNARFTDENGQENTILVIRDITEQKRLEDQIQREERLSAMGELASGVAHEIRNPLNTIGTIVQQLNKDFEPQSEEEEYDQLTRLVYKEVRRINKTVQDFLQFARPQPIEPSRFALGEFLQDIKLQHKAMAQKHNIAFKVSSGWTGEVKWDKNQMQQVFINLISNAIRAVSEGGQIGISTEELDDDTLKIGIWDTGEGIKKQNLPKIFNLYFTTKSDGTGIGLAVVQRIVYEHGGSIDVTSTLGKGTRFVITMPKKVAISEVHLSKG